MLTWNCFLDFAEGLIAKYESFGVNFDAAAMVYLENTAEQEPEADRQQNYITNLYRIQNIKEENYLYIQNLSFLTQILEKRLYQKLYPDVRTQIENTIKEELPEADGKSVKDFSERLLRLAEKGQREQFSVICERELSEYHMSMTNVQKGWQVLSRKLENIINSNIHMDTWIREEREETISPGNLGLLGMEFVQRLKLYEPEYDVLHGRPLEYSNPYVNPPESNASRETPPENSVLYVETLKYADPYVETPEHANPYVETPEKRAPHGAASEYIASRGTPPENSVLHGRPLEYSNESNVTREVPPERRVPYVETLKYADPYVETPEKGALHGTAPEYVDPSVKPAESNVTREPPLEKRVPYVETLEHADPYAKTLEKRAPHGAVPEYVDPSVKPAESNVTREPPPEKRVPYVETLEYADPYAETPEKRAPHGAAQEYSGSYWQTQEHDHEIRVRRDIRQLTEAYRKLEAYTVIKKKAEAYVPETLAELEPVPLDYLEEAWQMPGYMEAPSREIIEKTLQGALNRIMGTVLEKDMQKETRQIVRSIIEKAGHAAAERIMREKPEKVIWEETRKLFRTETDRTVREISQETTTEIVREILRQISREQVSQAAAEAGSQKVQKILLQTVRENTEKTSREILRQVSEKTVPEPVWNIIEQEVQKILEKPVFEAAEQENMAKIWETAEKAVSESVKESAEKLSEVSGQAFMKVVLSRELLKYTAGDIRYSEALGKNLFSNGEIIPVHLDYLEDERFWRTEHTNTAVREKLRRLVQSGWKPFVELRQTGAVKNGLEYMRMHAGSTARQPVYEAVPIVYSEEEHRAEESMQQTVRLRKQVEEVVHELKKVEEKTIVQNREVVEQQKQAVREVLEKDSVLLNGKNGRAYIHNEVQRFVEDQMEESVRRITARVYRQLEDRLKMERGRRGLL